MSSPTSPSLPHLVLFSRLPWSRTAKSRLRGGSEYDDSFINKLHECFVHDAMKLVADHPETQGICFWSTEEIEDLTKIKRESSISLIHKNQLGKNFEERFQAAFVETRAITDGSILMIGSDCPLIDTAILNEAFEACNSGNSVLGPAPNGGFYLIGLPPGAQIPEMQDCFSNGNEIEKVKEKLEAAHSVSTLPPLTDIDYQDDIHHLKEELHKRSEMKEWVPHNTYKLLMCS